MGLSAIVPVISSSSKHEKFAKQTTSAGQPLLEEGSRFMAFFFVGDRAADGNRCSSSLRTSKGGFFPPEGFCDNEAMKGR